MKNLLCAVALLFSTTTKFSSVAPVAHAMGRYEPDMCKVQIFEITSSSSAEIDEEDPDETDLNLVTPMLITLLERRRSLS